MPNILKQQQNLTYCFYMIFLKLLAYDDDFLQNSTKLTTLNQ